MRRGCPSIRVTRRYSPISPATPRHLTSPRGFGCGVAHTFDYKDPNQYRDKRVLVAGCAVSALEIACDLTMLGAQRVVTTNRRQRYIMQKIIAGVPIEHLIQTRHAALEQETLPKEALAEKLKEFILRTSGSPDL